MKKRAVRDLAEQVGDRFMKAALSGRGWDDAMGWLRWRMRMETRRASNEGYRHGLAAGRKERHEVVR